MFNTSMNHNDIINSSFPQKYNKDIIVLMYQGPHWIYAYWEISEKKRNAFEKQFGKNSLVSSKPVIKVVNLTKDYHFFVEINDSTDYWYINVGDCACIYNIQVGRRLDQGVFVELLNSNVCFVPTDTPIHISKNPIEFANVNHLRNNTGSDRTTTNNIFINEDRINTFTLGSTVMFSLNNNQGNPNSNIVQDDFNSFIERI